MTFSIQFFFNITQVRLTSNVYKNDFICKEYIKVYSITNTNHYLRINRSKAKQQKVTIYKTILFSPKKLLQALVFRFTFCVLWDCSEIAKKERHNGTDNAGRGHFLYLSLRYCSLSPKGWKAIAKERAFFWSVQHIVTWYVCDHTATATKVSSLLNFLKHNPGHKGLSQ